MKENMMESKLIKLIKEKIIKKENQKDKKINRFD